MLCSTIGMEISRFGCEQRKRPVICDRAWRFQALTLKTDIDLAWRAIRVRGRPRGDIDREHDPTAHPPDRPPGQHTPQTISVHAAGAS
jgi:hypothetical protein